jgi:germination protein M
MKRIPSIVVTGTLVAVLTACSAGSGGLGSIPTAAPTASAAPTEPDLTPVPSASTTPSTEPSESPDANASEPPSSTSAPAGTMIVRAYFVLGGEPGTAGVVPVLREVPKTTGVAAAAMTALLAGPTADESGEREITSAVPTGTRLLGITIKNGIATVNLSTEFDSGGGNASMQYRLAQVVYTLTQFSTVKTVTFQIEGQTVTVFGSEGIVLDGPVGRADYWDQLPAMFVDRPAYGAALGNPGRASGNADVFEATFRISILDAGGTVLVDKQIMATCGTGCRGVFDVTLAYTVAKGQWGTLRVYNPSAKDGSPEDVRDYRVWLTPAS